MYKQNLHKRLHMITSIIRQEHAVIAETIKAFLQPAQAWCLPLYFQLARTRYHSVTSTLLPNVCPLLLPLAETRSVLYIRHLPKQA